MHEVKAQKPLRLLIATGLYPPEMGGPATYTTFLEKHLQGHNVSLKVIPYSVVRKYPKIFRHIMYTCVLIWQTRHIDVLYALDTVSVGLPVYIAGLVTRTPYMLRVPGDYAWEQGQQRFGITETLDEYLLQTRNFRWQVKLMAWIQKKVATKARHVIVPSEYMRGVVGKWGVDVRKVTRIYSALKTLDVTTPKEVLRRKYEYEDFVVLTAGRLVPWKGMFVLIDAVTGLRARGIPISLHILGDGVCRADLLEKVKELHATQYIHFDGVCERSDMAERIKAADVFVLNTSYEGLSHQLVEVMSIGTPVVTTPVGGNVELVKNGETGMFVTYNSEKEIADALTRMYTEPEYGKILSEKARTQIGKFHEDVVIKEFVLMLQTLWKF